MRDEKLRKKLDQRLNSLKTGRNDYHTEWYNIARFAATSRTKFLPEKANDTVKRQKAKYWNEKLLDPHGISSFRILKNGMTSGLTSNSRPWFTLTHENEALLEEEGVRDWLSAVERSMYAFLAKTNFYGSAKQAYGDLGLFGTTACVMLENDKQGAVCHQLAAGQYWIGIGDDLTPNLLYIWHPMTVRECVMQFGDDTPKHIREQYDKGDYSAPVNIYSAIEPNGEYTGQLGSFPWTHTYWCPESKTEDEIMQRKGYYEQPFWAPRWEIDAGDTYGHSPAMEALPAMRELQLQAKRRNEAIDRLIKPELIVPPSVKLTRQAGRIVSASGITKEQVVNPNPIQYQTIAAIREEMDKCAEQIDDLSHADLFNAITNMRGVQPRTVEEIAARNEEKLTQLGPVIERVSNEMLEVIIERTFGIMARGNMLPPAPESLEAQPLKVEFVSILTQMQRMVGLGQIERSVGFIGNVAGMKPEVLDKVDADELVEEYTQRAGAPPKILRSAKETKDIREKNAEQQQMAQMAEMAGPAKEGVEAARLMSEADSSGQSLLDRVMPR